MAEIQGLIFVLEETKRLVSLAHNDFAWSGWNDATQALSELDGILVQLNLGFESGVSSLQLLFAPTGPLQELSLSSGWGEVFVELADRFDKAIARPCTCHVQPLTNLRVERDLGFDSTFAEVTVLRSPCCGQLWLKWFREDESITQSGRWYLGALADERAISVDASEAKGVLEQMEWYFFGGSYYGCKVGRGSGRF